MSFLGTFANIVSAAKPAIEIATTAAGLYSSYQDRKQYTDLMKAGQAESAEVRQNQAMLQRLARKNLRAAEGAMDEESYRRTAGIYQALLAGKQPQELEPFRNQFEEIETATQAKVRDIDRQALAARQQLATSVPQGGMRLRMLADLAMKTQDLKAAAIGEARDKTRQMNIELKNQYMKEATEFGRQQPAQLQKGYEGSAGILQGYPTTGPSGSQQLSSAVNAMREQDASLTDLGKALSGVAPKTEPTTVSYTPGAPLPESTWQKYVPSKTEQGWGFDDRYK